MCGRFYQIRARAALYRHLGIDYNDYIMNLEGLPMQILPFGKPIEELAPMA